MRVADEGADVGGRVERVADLDGGHQVGDAGHERVVQGPLHVGAGRGGAVLPRVDERARDGAVDRGVEIGVVEDDERGLATEFEVEPLDPGGGDLGHAPADGGGTGERGHRHVLVGHQVLACAEARTAHDVDDAVGQSGGRGGLGEEQRGEGGEFGGLEDDGVARGDGREDLPCGHLERVVPRGDGADHPDRLAAYVRRVVAAVLARGGTLQVARGAGEERRVVDGARYVELPAQLQRLAALERLRLGELLGALAQHGGEGVQRVGALAGRRAGPPGVRVAGGGDGRVHVVGAREFVRVDRPAGGRVDDRVAGS